MEKIRAVAQDKIEADDIKEQVLMGFYNFVCDLQEKCDQKRVELVKRMWDSSGESYPPDVRKELEDHGLLEG
jgi:uncharacterized tellurite resistance protein B-like protein